MYGAESYPPAGSGRFGLLGRRDWLGRALGRGLPLRVEPERRPDLGLDLGGDLGIVGEELFGVVPTLPEPGFAVGEERARLLDEVVLDPEVEQGALARDPGPVLDVE